MLKTGIDSVPFWTQAESFQLKGTSFSSPHPPTLTKEDGHLSRSPLIGDGVTSLFAQSENHTTDHWKGGNARESFPTTLKKGDSSAAFWRVKRSVNILSLCTCVLGGC